VSLYTQFSSVQLNHFSNFIENSDGRLHFAQDYIHQHCIVVGGWSCCCTDTTGGGGGCACRGGRRRDGADGGGSDTCWVLALLATNDGWYWALHGAPPSYLPQTNEQ